MLARITAIAAILLFSGCLFGDPHKLHSKAYQTAYIRYQTDAIYRKKIDDEWRHANAVLGYKRGSHLYGPERVRKFGIEPVRGLSPDDR